MRIAEFFKALSRARTPVLLVAALLVAAATLLPVWGMVLVSTQYPEGLRMIVYPARIAGDLAEINALNHYIGMTPVSEGFFVELQYLRPVLVTVAAALVLAAAARRTRWLTMVPLVVLAGLGVGGLGMMRYRLWQFGHQLDPQAPITIEPFTPPMIGLNQIAQFATYSYFSWGFFLPLVAAVLLALVAVADRRRDVIGARGALLVAA